MTILIGIMILPPKYPKELNLTQDLRKIGIMFEKMKRILRYVITIFLLTFPVCSIQCSIMGGKQDNQIK